MWLTLLCLINAGFRLHNIFVRADSHHVRLGDYGVTKSCHDLTDRHDRVHTGSRPIIAGQLSSIYSCPVVITIIISVTEGVHVPAELFCVVT